MRELKYYIHLYWVCMSRSLISRLEYKKDLIISIMGFFIENVAALCSIVFTIRNIPSLSGWNIYQMGFLYGFTMMPIAVDHMFTDELWMVAYFRVRRGDLDRYFLRPLPVLFQVIAETFQPEAFGELLVGVAMLSYCGMKCNITLNAGAVVMMLTATFVGALIVTAVKIITAAPAFILKKSGMFMQVIYNFRDYTRYPIGIYPKAVRVLLLFIFPFGLIISMPVEVLMFQTVNPWLVSGGIVIMAAVLMTLACLIWNACVRKYESTGS